MIDAINSILTLYSWIVAAILIAFLLLIGRFNKIKLKEKSYYQLLVVPLVCFLAAAIWYALEGKFAGIIVPDLLFLVGGLALIIQCYILYRTMMGGRR